MGKWCEWGIKSWRNWAGHTAKQSWHTGTKWQTTEHWAGKENWRTVSHLKTVANKTKKQSILYVACSESNASFLIMLTMAVDAGQLWHRNVKAYQNIERCLPKEIRTFC